MAEGKVWLLEGNNYANWKFRMEVLLAHKGLLDCIEEPLNLADLAEQEADTANEKLRKRALRAERVARDRSCRNLLVNRIADDQLDHVKDARTAKETWDALRNVFERVGVAGKLFLKKQFQELRLAEGSDVQAFLLRFEKVLRELKAAGVKLEKEDIVCQLLLALPRSFDALITAVETIEPKDLTLEYVKKRILDEQVKRNAQAVPEDPEESVSGESAFAGKRREMKCFGCGRPGHKRADCPEGRSDRTEPGKEPGIRFTRNTRCGDNETTENQIAFGVATGNAFVFSAPPAVVDRRIEWYLDSGATAHMVRDKSLFAELRPLERKVRIAVAKTGQSLIAVSAGTVRVKMLLNGKWLQAVVNDVLYVPELQCNLFSVRRLEDIGMSVKIGGGIVSIEQDGRVVGRGRRAGQLYVLDVFRDDGAESGVVKATAMVSQKDDDELWPRRFGHLGEANIRNLWRNGMDETTTNGYRIWNHQKKKLFSSWKVVFDKRRRDQQETGAVKYIAPAGARILPVVPTINDERPADEEPAEEEPADVPDGGGNEESFAGPSERQLVVVELTEDGDEQEPSGALPSQPERDHCSAVGSTRRSERERKTPDSTEATDDDLMANALSAKSFAENLPSTIDGFKRCGEWNYWERDNNSELEASNEAENVYRYQCVWWRKSTQELSAGCSAPDQTSIVRLSGGVGWQPPINYLATPHGNDQQIEVT